jgi:hypothetical protein
MAGDEKLPQGWSVCVHPEGFAQELRLELSKGHPLHGRDLSAVAVRDDRDDALFRSPAGEMFVVHLTWRQSAEPPPWPMVVWQSTRHQPDEFDAWSAGFYGAA